MRIAREAKVDLKLKMGTILCGIAMSLFWGCFSITAAQQQEKGASEGFKNPQQSTQYRGDADIEDVVDIGAIYISPNGRETTARHRATAPTTELSRLEKERQEILRSLQRLEKKIKARRVRAKRLYKRPCV